MRSASNSLFFLSRKRFRLPPLFAAGQSIPEAGAPAEAPVRDTTGAAGHFARDYPRFMLPPGDAGNSRSSAASTGCRSWQAAGGLSAP
jgi:hypothetical protein